jgi:geranylgeranyl transferase type-2 subunit alpha
LSWYGLGLIIGFAFLFGFLFPTVSCLPCAYFSFALPANSSPQTLSTQIGSLKELLSLEPESKWPLDTLVHYTLLLLRQQQTPHHRVAEREGVEEREEKERWEERERMKGECRGWLSLLERVDGKRKERYRDLGKGLEGI